jgi:alpha-beta hydrolase superfamily lysophospholipase
MLSEGWRFRSEIVGRDPLFQMSCVREDRLGQEALLVIHGLGEHVGRHLSILKHLDPAVGAVFGLDHRGHGRSSGKRGDGSLEDYVSAIATCIQEFHAFLHREWGFARIHVLGQSMGGLIALRLPVDLPIASMTVSAPLLGLKEAPSFWKRGLGLGLSWIHPSASLKSQLDARKLSHDVAVVEAYRKDPWVHDRITPRLFFSMLQAMDLAFQNAVYPFPVQMLVPLEDAIVDARRSFVFFDMIQAPEKRLRAYPRFYHEPFHELGKEKALEDLNSWILKFAVKQL